MKRNYIFDFSQITSLSKFYTIYANEVGCASYFGRNLDALNDSLSADLELPCCFSLRFKSEKQKEKFARLVAVLEHAALQEPDLELLLEVEN